MTYQVGAQGGYKYTRGKNGPMFYIIEARLPCLHTYEPGGIVIQGLVPVFFKNKICEIRIRLRCRVELARGLLARRVPV